MPVHCLIERQKSKSKTLDCRVVRAALFDESHADDRGCAWADVPDTPMIMSRSPDVRSGVPLSRFDKSLFGHGQVCQFAIQRRWQSKSRLDWGVCRACVLEIRVAPGTMRRINV